MVSGNEDRAKALRVMLRKQKVPSLKAALRAAVTLLLTLPPQILVPDEFSAGLTP